VFVIVIIKLVSTKPKNLCIIVSISIDNNKLTMDK